MCAEGGKFIEGFMFNSSIVQALVDAGKLKKNATTDDLAKLVEDTDNTVTFVLGENESVYENNHLVGQGNPVVCGEKDAQ